MTTYRFEHQDREPREVHNCSTAMSAVEYMAQNCTWARGHADYELGVIWPFNPDMTVNGIPAYRVAAGEYGGSWLAAASRRDALAVAA